MHEEEGSREPLDLAAIAEPDKHQAGKEHPSRPQELLRKISKPIKAVGFALLVLCGAASALLIVALALDSRDPATGRLDPNFAVACCTIVLVWVSLLQYRDASKGTREALELSRLDRRAWIVVTDAVFTGETVITGVRMSAMNVGGTPAVEVYYDCHETVTADDDEVVPPDPPLGRRPRVLGPRQEWPVEIKIARPLDHLNEVHGERRHFLCVIRYQDTAGLPHVTRLCVSRGGRSAIIGPWRCSHAGASDVS